jgi:hypothetical protein
MAERMVRVCILVHCVECGCNYGTVVEMTKRGGAECRSCGKSNVGKGKGEQWILARRS